MRVSGCRRLPWTRAQDRPGPRGRHRRACPPRPSGRGDKELDERDEEPVVIYHSHTATEAYPSRTDVNLAQEPAAHYVLVSTRDGAHASGPVEFRSFRIVDGVVTEEEVEVIADGS
jgi:proteasome lid subunit RPN8/RPN11